MRPLVAGKEELKQFQAYTLASPFSEVALGLDWQGRGREAIFILGFGREKLGEVGRLGVSPKGRWKRKMLKATRPGESKKGVLWALRWALHVSWPDGALSSWTARLPRRAVPAQAWGPRAGHRRRLPFAERLKIPVISSS